MGQAGGQTTSTQGQAGKHAPPRLCKDGIVEAQLAGGGARLARAPLPARRQRVQETVLGWGRRGAQQLALALHASQAEAPQGQQGRAHRSEQV